MKVKNRIAIAVPVACLAGAAYFCVFGIRTTSIESLRRLTIENVQIGATPEAVIQFLDSRHLEPSLLFKPELMSMGGHRYSGQNIVVGMKLHTANALLWRERIYLIFVFDENHRLVSYDVFPVYESL